MSAAGSALDLGAERYPSIAANTARPFHSSRVAGVIAAGREAKNRIVVEFKNAPKGLRVTADPSNADAIDLSMGFAMADGL